MARITLPDPDGMTPEQRTQYERFPANLTRGLVCASPDLAAGVMSIGVALRMSGFYPKLRELVILRIATLGSSAYEWMQHVGIAKDAGCSEAEIAGVAAGDLGAFDARTAAVLQFANECFENRRASDDTFARVRDVLSDSEIATLTLLIGQYVLALIFLQNLDIELDGEPTTWARILPPQQ